MATALFGVAPDLIQLLPVLVWSASQANPLASTWDYISAVPGAEPAVPASVQWLSHHLHCITHSAVIAAVVAIIVWRVRGALWARLIGWWLHIVLDVPTHSNDYYPVPFLYPLTYWAIDGIAWTNPWLLGANYAALAIAWLVLIRTRTCAARHA